MNSKVLDPSFSHVDSDVLLSLASNLDAKGIDVILGKAADFPSDQRPRIAHLSGFVGTSRDWGTISPESTSVAFSHGFIGGIFAFKSDVSTNNTQVIDNCKNIYSGKESAVCAFVERWLAVPKSKRVFVAFTREDSGLAAQVSAELQSQGYTTFTFLKDKDEPPWADERIAGAVFASSGVRLVLDTANSRGSAGVAFEKACCEYLLWSRSPYQSWIDKLRAA